MVANEKILSMLEQHEIAFDDIEQASTEYRETKKILLGIIHKQHKALEIATAFLKALETIEKYKHYGELAKNRLETINKILGD